MPARKRSQRQQSRQNSDLYRLKIDRKERSSLNSFKEDGGDVEVLRALTRLTIAFKNGPSDSTPGKILKSYFREIGKQREDRARDLKAIMAARTALDRLYADGERTSLYFSGCAILDNIFVQKKAGNFFDAKARKLLIKNMLYYLALCQLHDYVRAFTAQPNRILAPLFSKAEGCAFSANQLETEYLRAREYVGKLPPEIVSAFRSAFQPARYWEKNLLRSIVNR